MSIHLPATAATVQRLSTDKAVIRPVSEKIMYHTQYCRCQFSSTVLVPENLLLSLPVILVKSFHFVFIESGTGRRTRLDSTTAQGEFMQNSRVTGLSDLFGLGASCTLVD